MGSPTHSTTPPAHAALCDRYAGRFLHPNTMPGGGTRDPKKAAATAHALKAAGFMVFDGL
ncbi:hypothetical protein [Streptomyces sp. NPDC059224]|uniref:hypothetical protein n=1 Tax=Streptomyces sp. NPDC059224 TaxID=3346775 RepID=UPI003695E999